MAKQSDKFPAKIQYKITAKKCKYYHDKYREQLMVNPRGKRWAMESAKQMVDDCYENMVKYC
jgi:hypothetical protein